MNIHQEIYIDTSIIGEEQLVQVLRDFCEACDSWQFLADESRAYEDAAGEESCGIAYNSTDSDNKAFVAVTKKNDTIFYVPNIVPQSSSELSMDEYNIIARHFGLDFRKFLRQSKIPIKIAIPNPIITIERIIKSKTAREKFLGYLSHYPLSHHPLDIRRLDHFICIYHKRSRSALDFWALERFLVEDKDWRLKDASWCCDRIRTGLDILSACESW